MPLGGRDWQIRDIAPGAPPVSTPEDDASSRVVANAILELREPPGANVNDVLAFAVTFETPDSDQCVSLEIGFVTANAGGTPLDRVSSECTTSPGRRRQLAIAARGPAVAKAVVYRIIVHGTADIIGNELTAGAVGESMRGLRTRVAPDTIATLDSAIKEVKTRAAYASRVDWPLASAQAVASVMDGSSKRDALPGVQVILRSLGDKHSWATILDDRGRLTVNGQSVEYEAPRLRLQRMENGRVVGWLTIPRLAAVSGLETQQYSVAIHSGIGDSVKAGACGYVVDLSGHTGGNMWPGLDGLGPLLGDEAVVGSFKPGSFSWKIDKDEISSRVAAHGLVDPEGLWRAELPKAPVAVIVGPMTASSGEAVAIAFSGRPDTRFFGRRTHGLATSNQMVELGDGLVAFVVVAAMADREGKTFPTGIAPGTEDADAETAAAHALTWLGSMPNCARPG